MKNPPTGNWKLFSCLYCLLPTVHFSSPKHHRPSAHLTNELSPRQPPALGPPVAAFAPDQIGRRRSRRRRHRVFGIAPLWFGPEANARRLPRPPMPIPGRQGMGDFMQDRIAHRIDVVEQCQRARQGNNPRCASTRPKPPPGVIETKCPADQLVFPHQCQGKISRFVKVHGGGSHPISHPLWYEGGRHTRICYPRRKPTTDKHG